MRRVTVLLDHIINKGKDVDDQLFNVEKQILETDKPNTWNVWKSKNMERTLEVDFQKFAIAVTQKTQQQLKELSTFTFYATVEMLEEQNPKRNGNGTN